MFCILLQRLPLPPHLGSRPLSLLSLPPPGCHCNVRVDHHPLFLFFIFRFSLYSSLIHYHLFNSLPFGNPSANQENISIQHTYSSSSILSNCGYLNVLLHPHHHDWFLAAHSEVLAASFSRKRSTVNYEAGGAWCVGG